jgi:hypothetical protein
MPLLKEYLRMSYQVFGRVVITMVFLFSTLAFVPPQEKLAAAEHELKAVYLFNFAQFVEWPLAVFPDADSPIVIGILGKDPFGTYLEETVEGEVINGHPIEVARYANVKQIKRCHILFIHPSLSPKLDDILEELKGKNVLTVSDGSTFASQGGMIRFVNDSNKIKLQINLNAVKASNITISSKLLRLSEIVE